MRKISKYLSKIDAHGHGHGQSEGLACGDRSFHFAKVGKLNRAAAFRAKNWLVEDAANTKAKFEKMANQVSTATLQPSAGGGLGMTRALGEWAPSDLYAAGQAVEDFYMRYW